jgi:hypothetical protein
VRSGAGQHIGQQAVATGDQHASRSSSQFAFRDDGELLSLASSVSVTRTGDVYLIRRPNGDIVWAEVLVNDFMNVSVDVAPDSNVSGLLGNANGDTDDDLAKRDGTVLPQPVSFEDLYQNYGESWRVAASESLLSVCGDRKVERGNPREPFFASDLNPAQFESSQEVCTAAGVEDEFLRGACTLDVAVLGDKAVDFYVVAPTPVALIQAGGPE